MMEMGGRMLRIKGIIMVLGSVCRLAFATVRAQKEQSRQARGLGKRATGNQRKPGGIGTKEDR
jgi:hypothetical protein